MLLLNKALLKRLVVVMVFITTTLLGAVWLTNSLRFIQIIVNHSISLGDYFALISFLLPDLLAQVMPLCIFITVIFIYYRLDSDHELLALRASGQSNLQIAKPALILASAAMCIVALMTLYIVPYSYQLFRNHEYQIRNELSAIFLQEGAFTTLNKVTVYVKTRDPDGTLHNIFIYNDNREQSYAIMAQKGKIQGHRLLLSAGMRQEVNRTNHKVTFFRFSELSYDLLGLTRADKPRPIKPHERSIRELLFSLEEKDPGMSAKLRAEAHHRFLLPLLVPLFALIAVYVIVDLESQRKKSYVPLVKGGFAAIIIYVAIVSLLNLNRHLRFAIPLAYMLALSAATLLLWQLASCKKLRR